LPLTVFKESFALEREPDRCLHHARRTSCSWGTECSARLISSRVECHRSVYVREIRAVENVVSLPAQLNCPLLSPAKTLEKRHIAVEDMWKPNQVPLQIADSADGSWLREA